jgi:type I restriction enzyme S subunit
MLTVAAFKEVEILTPPLAEQRKIAAILSSVDETIEKTEAVIAQLDVVKKAMLEELLTRGIPGRHSRFKQTEIGEVPAEWAVAKLGELVDVLSGFPFKSELFTEDATRGTPLIRIRDLRRDKTTARFLGSFDPRYLMEPGEILVGMDGDFDVCRWRGAPALLNQRVCRVTPREGRGLVSSFLGYLLVPLLLRINASTSATTVKHLSVRDISSSTIALPGIREQELIGDALTALDDRRLQEQAVLGFLTRTKQSLAGELLSGNLRVGLTRGDE